MSQKDKQSVKSDKSKDKKKKSTKVEKKDSKILPPQEIIEPQFIARVNSRLGDKETKQIANGEADPQPLMQTFTTFQGQQMENHSGLNHQYDNYTTVQRGLNNQYRTNKFMAQTQPQFQEPQYIAQQMTQQITPQMNVYQPQQYGQQPQYAQPQYGQQQFYSTNPQAFAQKASYDYRHEKVKEQVNMSLLPKRNEIIEQIQKIDNRIDEIKYQTAKIEGMTREECEKTIDRLKTAETQKLQILFHDKNELLKDIDQIDALQTRVQQIHDFNSPNNLDVYEQIDRLSKKRVKTQIDIYPDDLPQEFIRLKQLQQQNQMLSKLMEFKNEVIWKLYNDQQVESRRMREDLEKQANQEFQEWYNLVDQYQQELNRYKLQCAFCGINFDYQMINTDCHSNIEDARIQFECEEIPPEQIFGTRRHFFSKAKQLQQSNIQIEENKV